MADVMGYDDTDFEVVGDDDLISGAVLGAALRRAASPARHLRLPPKADWRKGQLAPGVMARQEGLIPLPMTPLQGGGVFSATVASITWQGQLQKPFRGERLLVTTVRTGTTATGRLIGQIFVGTDLQLADISGIDLETVGNPASFGTRLTLLQAPPGVLIRLPVTISLVPTSPDTVAGFVTLLGRVIN